MRADRAHHGDEEAAYLAYCRDQEEGPVHEAESADEAIKVATERAKRLVADERLRLTHSESPVRFWVLSAIRQLIAIRPFSGHG